MHEGEAGAVTAAAPLAEVFVSFQGEGPLVGVRQAFVRVRGCDIHCSYCDTPHARAVDGDCTVAIGASGDRVTFPNPFTPADALHLVREMLALGPIHSIALTGGEPLLYPEFVAQFARLAAAEGLPVFLETGGHRPEDLARVIDDIAFVSLDYKLPPTLREPVPVANFVLSYRIAGARCVAVKMVVTADILPLDIAVACGALAQIRDTGPLILQPVTAIGGGPQPPSSDHLHALFIAAAKHIRDVRVIPQCHRILGVA